MQRNRPTWLQGNSAVADMGNSFSVEVYPWVTGDSKDKAESTTGGLPKLHPLRWTTFPWTDLDVGLSSCSKFQQYQLEK